MRFNIRGRYKLNLSSTKRLAAMFRMKIVTLFLIFVAVGCNENKDEFHKVLSSKLYANKNCIGKYFQISESGLYGFLDNGREIKLDKARLVKVSDNLGRIDQNFGDSTLKIDIRIDSGVVYFSPPHLDPPIPYAVWKYRESTGKGTKEAFWSKIDAASPPSITYPCDK